MSMLYGVLPILDENYESIDEISESSFRRALESKLVKKGDKVVLVSGLVAGKSGANLMLIKKL